MPQSVRILRRRCQICGKKKPNTRKCWDFDKDTPTRLNLICRRCAWQSEHADAIAEKQRRYRAEHADELAEKRRRYYAERKRAKLANLRPVHTIEEQADNLRRVYGQRSVRDALGID